MVVRKLYYTTESLGSLPVVYRSPQSEGEVSLLLFALFAGHERMGYVQVLRVLLASNYVVEYSTACKYMQ